VTYSVLICGKTMDKITSCDKRPSLIQLDGVMPFCSRWGSSPTSYNCEDFKDV